MGDNVELAFRRAAARLLVPGERLVVAVSGGGDSVALLHLLHRFARRGAVKLHVAHLDHGLRRGSRADRRFVETLARSLDLPCRAGRREVPRERRRDESPEEAARRVRRAFLLEVLAETAADRVALGHTLDDQAETVLMRLARGAGARALAGIAAQGPGPFVRPLLGLEREPLRRWLERRNLPWREDASNRDLRFDRNRVRALVVPLLAQSLNPRAARHVVKAAEGLREDADHLDALAAARFGALARRDRAGRPVLDARGLAGEADPIARRVAHLALCRAGVDPRRAARRHVDALIDLARGPGGREVHLPGRLLARRRGREIRFALR